MNPLTEKSVIPLPKAHSGRAPALLRALYKLPYPFAQRPGSKVRISRLAEKTAFRELLAGTFNSRVLEAPRLKRQFETMARLLTRVPVRRLSYQRGLDHLPEVRDAILADFRRLGRKRERT